MQVLDLFSGIGGFSLGLERAGMETVAFCEIEDYPQKVLEKHWPGIPIYNDVTKLSKKVLDDDGITVDVICGGWPCQDLSRAGSKGGINAERSGLWKHYARLIGELRPQYAIMENSSALISGDRGRWLGSVLGDLAQIGYDLEWHCIPASYLGANHERDRFWAIAYPMREGLQGGEKAIYPRFQRALRHELIARRFCSFDSLSTIEPTLCRGAHGIPNQSHRIKGLGNAVVPQIPEILGEAIMNYERRNNDH
tara:strand:- start:70 stop:825 length:756 start_codon:yes stop_codon:yes gene_type:complete